MLPEILKGPDWTYAEADSAEWNRYLDKIGDYKNKIDIDFLRQICFEHFNRFNNYFPKFNLNINKIYQVSWTAKQIDELIRYDENEDVDFWYDQFDNFLEDKKNKYIIFNKMIKNLTWPFPPVVINNQNDICMELGCREAGRPYHLIEGTHRVSYLKRMLSLKMIKEESMHKLVLLDP